MTTTTKLATTALAAITALAVPAAAFAANDFAAHQDLLTAVAETGVRVYINPVQCGKENVDGFYISNGPGFFVICQDNAKPGGEQVRWTANDLDTIRHEAIHLIQDCKDGRGDNSLQPVIGDAAERSRYVFGALGRKRVKGIIDAYIRRGTSDHQIHNEVEAFAFAYRAEASDIATGVRNYCGVK
ncbi:hypothetical protein [Synechococcus phage S-N03]|uniref:Uncharacterized protein n=1 Tax=Synechococcus phage S-N03 TaxID=2718943 RepID=A0A6G8R5P5_9CAUD|nr:hypothetical protein PQC09_gp069 [Synechococcus phage S-N03]QIN96704.1 hypothetical protein [Synechococcus phage S-N03]